MAIEDRESIFMYIAGDNPTAAVALDERFQKKASQLLIDHPRAGRPGRVEGTRELLAHRHYILVYDVDDVRVRILRILHTSLQYPPPPKRLARPRKSK